MAQSDLLLELGVEELPVGGLAARGQALGAQVVKALGEHRIAHGSVRTFATPRRLAVLVRGLTEKAADQQLQRRGPSLRVAFAEGKPTPAAHGFARSCGVALSALERVEDGADGYLMWRARQAGAPTQALLPALLKEAIVNLPCAKPMRWGSASVPFVRPLRWLVALFGSEVVEFSLFGQQAGRFSFGHRVHHPQPICLDRAEVYEEKLETGWVIAAFDQRRMRIVEQVKAIAAAAGAQVDTEQALVDEVTALCEWPVALKGHFPAAFLELPSAVLVSSMTQHQKYFALTDQGGALLASFITIANLESSAPEKVIAGNEKVIQPRLFDARFFFEQDRKISLWERRAGLKTVLFQKRLGSLYAKTCRLEALCNFLAPALEVDVNLARRCAQLSKSDLQTQMVQEFADLQGIMAEQYALHEGEDVRLAQALREQYLPRKAIDSLPATALGALLALADRLDTVVGIFAIGRAPTGNSDPFGVRRAALGVIKILLDGRYAVDLWDFLGAAAGAYQSQGLRVEAHILDKVWAFIMERARSFYQDQGVDTKVFLAISALEVRDLCDFDARLRALRGFQKEPAALALASANKRVANILAKAGTFDSAMRPELFQVPAERALADALAGGNQALATATAEGDYGRAFAHLVALKEPLDDFFALVLVNTEDKAVRDNRLALLKAVRQFFLAVADLSLLCV